MKKTKKLESLSSAIFSTSNPEFSMVRGGQTDWVLTNRNRLTWVGIFGGGWVVTKHYESDDD